MSLLSLLFFTALSQAGVPPGLLSFGTFTEVVFVTDKAKKELFIYEFRDGAPRLVTQYPSDIGKKQGDKMRENDMRTPTGIYFLLERLSQPQIPFSLYGSLAFTTDYPNIFDRLEGKGGSGIWLHAVPDKIPLTRGSRGCVVVRNDVIKKLEPLIELKHTPLLIVDSLELIERSEWETRQKKFLGFFEQWRKAWESQDIASYMEFYDDSFRSQKMDKAAWQKHKEKLKRTYSFIEVQLSTPLVLINRDQVVMRTLQAYRSDKHSDFGLKTIHARYSEEKGFRIIREEWEAKDFEKMKLAKKWDADREPTAQSQ